jgi:hypothetical protein
MSEEELDFKFLPAGGQFHLHDSNEEYIVTNIKGQTNNREFPWHLDPR